MIDFYNLKITQLLNHALPKVASHQVAGDMLALKNMVGFNRRYWPLRTSTFAAIQKSLGTALDPLLG
jgi:hypothetical protein